MTLDFYKKEKQAKQAILNRVKSIVSTSTDSEDLLLAIKAVESLENVQHFPEFGEIIEAMIGKVLSMDLTKKNGEDMTLLSRALKLKDIPVGSERRWRQLNVDDENFDIQGHIVVGDRTLESFDDKIMEEYYKGVK